MRIILTTGGTGGHIYPATTLADLLIKDDKANEILFIGNRDRMEATEIPRLGYRFIGIEAAKFNSSKNKLHATKVLYKSYKACLSIVKDFKPDIIVGFGGYVTVPVVLAGVKLGIKTIIHEQNSLAGMANRMLGHFVNKVVICYESGAKGFNKNKTLLLGNPRESSVLDFNKDKDIFKSFNLDCDKKTVLIVMGSLGSYTVNQKMVGILEGLKDRDFNVIYVTGKDNYDEFKEQFKEANNLRIVPYINQFNVAGNCSLVVSRGGATSACEFMALGVPTIIVPSPYVTNNHQYLNAKAMLDNGASILLEENKMEVNSTVDLICNTIKDDTKLASMSQAALQMSHPNAANDFIKLIKDLIN